MIARSIPKKADVRDDFTRLGEYIAAAEEEGEKLDRLWMVNCSAGEEIEDLGTALTEIEAVRAMRPDVKAKTYHLLLSFRLEDREKLTEQTLRTIESDFAKALGYGDHQRIAGTHVNTENFHMHVAINKVHPETLRVHTPFRDYKMLAKTAREMEQRYGLEIDRGMTDQDYTKDTSKIGTLAQDFERHSWQQSFQSWLIEHKDELIEGIAEAQSWRTLHRTLSTYNVELRLRGNGLVFAHKGDDQTMKASAFDRTCSKPALEKRLGPFQTAEQKASEASVAPRRQYKARPMLKSYPGQARLWRRFLGTGHRPLVQHKGLVRRALGNWKLFLLTEAYNDPMAMTIILVYRQLFATLLLQGAGMEKSPAHLLRDRQQSRLSHRHDPQPKQPGRPAGKTSAAQPAFTKSAMPGGGHEPGI